MDNKNQPPLQQPAITPQTSTNHLITLLICGFILLGLIFAGIYFFMNGKKPNLNTKNLPVSSSSTKKTNKSINESIFNNTNISYKIPNGWKTRNMSSDQNGSDIIPNFISSDAEFNQSQVLSKGAEIRVFKNYFDTSKSLVAYIQDELKSSQKKSGDIKTIKIGEIDAVNTFVCLEDECIDTYSFVKNNVVWQIGLRCAPNCNTQSNMKISKYQTDFDNFLASINIK
jgi:hypothetical protein